MWGCEGLRRREPGPSPQCWLSTIEHFYGHSGSASVWDTCLLSLPASVHLGLLSAMWENQLESSAPGFGLAHPGCGGHLVGKDASQWMGVLCIYLICLSNNNPFPIHVQPRRCLPGLGSQLSLSLLRSPCHKAVKRKWEAVSWG